MEQQKGVPWVSRITWFWALVFTFFTSGIFALALGFYLSLWVLLRNRKSYAFWAYLLMALCLLLGLLPAHILPSAKPWEVISTAVSVLWIVSGFVLRRDLQVYYARPDGSLPPISALWTAIFSVYYLNYWLWVLRDTV